MHCVTPSCMSAGDGAPLKAAWGMQPQEAVTLTPFPGSRFCVHGLAVCQAGHVYANHLIAVFLWSLVSRANTLGLFLRRHACSCPMTCVSCHVR